MISNVNSTPLGSENSNAQAGTAALESSGLSPFALESGWDNLLSWFRTERFYLVAFSAGIDSTLVLKAAVKALGSKQVLAVTADSPSLARSELELSKVLAQEIGVRQILLQTSELENPEYRKNDGSRCYFCKSALYASVSAMLGSSELRLVLQETGRRVEDCLVVDGLNLDDLKDIRPGRRAAEQAGVLHPLVECGIGKSEVRAFARHVGLSNWNKPAMACLASRIPQGTEVNSERLSLVEQAEAVLLAAGYRGCRVRLHVLSGPETKNLARIEVPKSSVGSFSGKDTEFLSQELRKIGFHFVTLDLEGYRLGGGTQG